MMDLIIRSCDAGSGKMEISVENSAFRTESQLENWLGVWMTNAAKLKPRFKQKALFHTH